MPSLAAAAGPRSASPAPALAAASRMSAARPTGRHACILGLPAVVPRLPLQQAGWARRTARARALPLRCRAQSVDVPVRFSVQQEVEWGESMRLVGSHPALGSWKVRKAAGMAWQEGHVWTAEVSLPPGTTIEFKCVRARGDHDASWEDGGNRVLTVPASGPVTVALDWGGDMAVEAADGAALPVASRSRSGSDSDSDWSPPAGSSGSSFDDSMALLPQWQGKELRFMQSNEHTRDRRGVWETAGLQGAALHLVAGDRDAANWLGKLEVVKRLLVDNAPEARPSLDALSHAYVYMQWIATGAVECVEGGGHHRPNRHAELARSMFRSLEWVIGERGGADPAVALVGRRLQARLPSFTDQFTQSTPLTRIRDIAHRNDIPKELKAEIKHTLQNKLHRNAGPEDLHTTEAMLARVTAHPGQYSDAFVHEFRTFTAELRDFFNAGSLADMLWGLRPALDEGSAQLLDHFNAAKGRLDEAGEGADLNVLMDALHATTTVRALLASGLSSGLRNDAPDSAMAMRQKWRQCEVRAEDYAFVLLSRFINAVEWRGGAQAIAAGSDGGWALPIGALVLGLRHIGLSGYHPKECMAVERELAAWQRAGGFSDRETALRLKASLQRLRRLTEAYSQLMLDAFADRATAMGRALGLEPERYQVFTEAEIRASLVFQLSKLCSLLIKAANTCAGGSPWDVVMAGEAQGLLLRVPALEPGCLAGAHGEDAVLLVDSATGDEEVSALGANLRGIILQQDLPHLSHLGVRTRQEGVPFVTCEDAEVVGAATGPLLFRRVRLSAAADGVSLEPADEAAPSSANGNGSANGSAASAAPKRAAQAGEVQRVGSVQVVPLEQATVASAGAKAAACGDLLRLAAACSTAAADGGGSVAVLSAADGVVLPFGCMEAAVAADGKQGRLSELLQRLDGAVAEAAGGGGGGASNGLAQLDAVCGEIQGLLGSLAIPQQALQRVAAAFQPGDVAIVRSSANVEDLAGMSGAGLYESIPNVDAGDPRALQAAVAGVWASLFSRRAVLSRHAAGLPQGAACMAVVVQRQLTPDLCFVLHTRHPVTGDDGVLSAELAPGLGETLASGTRGTAWRLDVDKSSAAVSVAAFANFSRALLRAGSAAALAGAGAGGALYAPPSAVAGAAGTAVAEARAEAPVGGVQPQVVDYSEEPMSVSADVRAGVGRRLLAVALALEHEFGGAQDVEGCFVGDELFVVQTRPQP